MISLGYALGPLIGGLLSQKASWKVSPVYCLAYPPPHMSFKWCFWVTLPVAAFAVAVVLLVLPLKPVEGNMRRYVNPRTSTGDLTKPRT